MIELPNPNSAGTVGASGGTMVNSDRLHLRINLQLKGLLTKYGLNSGVIGAIMTGSLYLVCVCQGDDTALSTPAKFKIYPSCRLRFLD